MKNRWKIPLIAFAALVFLVGVGPFLVPVPPLESSVTPQELASPDSNFINIETSLSII